VARMVDMRNAYRILVGKLEGNRSLGVSRRRWEGNIKLDRKETRCEDVDWIHVS